MWCFPTWLKIVVWEKQPTCAEKFEHTEKNNGDNSLATASSISYPSSG
jgi:hypothetical protein